MNPFLRRGITAVVAAGMSALPLAGTTTSASAEESLHTFTVDGIRVHAVGDTLEVGYHLTVDIAPSVSATTFRLTPDGDAGMEAAAGDVLVNSGGTCTPDGATSSGSVQVICTATAPKPSEPGTYRILGVLQSASPEGTSNGQVPVRYVVPNDSGTAWSVTQWCAHSVQIVRDIPGTGKAMVWGKRMPAGRRVVTAQRFAHGAGLVNASSCQQGELSAYRRVGSYTRVNELVWGTPMGLHGTSRAPKGTRPGVYRYSAVAKAVACQLAEGTTIIRCTKSPVIHAVSHYRVTVAKSRALKWSYNDYRANNSLPEW